MISEEGGQLEVKISKCWIVIELYCENNRDAKSPFLQETHPVSLRLKQSNQPVFGQFLSNFIIQHPIAPR